MFLLSFLTCFLFWVFSPVRGSERPGRSFALLRLLLIVASPRKLPQHSKRQLPATLLPAVSPRPEVPRCDRPRVFVESLLRFIAASWRRLRLRAVVGGVARGWRRCAPARLDARYARDATNARRRT